MLHASLRAWLASHPTELRFDRGRLTWPSRGTAARLAAAGARGVDLAASAPDTATELEALVASAIGINAERGDSLTVSSSTFVSALEGIKKPWYDMDWAATIMRQALTILIMAVVVLGVIRPLINRIMVPAAQGGPGEAVVSLEDDVDLDTVEIEEGESLEDIKAKLKPKKAAISPEMLDTANTYDDKVAVIRMIVSDEAGRVSNVFKTMMQQDMDTV